MEPTNLPTNNGDGAPKRGKKQKAAPGLAAAPIFLTPEQLSKLWAIAVGGQLAITTDTDTGLVICAVSLESFTQAMPLLLDRL